jgi:hypothetical protein
MKSFILLTSFWFVAVQFALGAEPDYEQPKRLPGTVYARGTSNVLFRTVRTATRDGNTVRVLCVYNYPDGKLAARERITFIDGKLAFFQLDDLQADAQGTTRVSSAPNGKQKLEFDYTTVSGGRAKKKTDTETTDGEVLVGDMIPYFLVAHWNELMRGQPASFRFIASDRLETVGFKLVKEGDVNWRGKSAVRLRMEPTSVIIRQLVDPLFFIVEKDGAHRVLMYDGRVTPRVRDGNSWKDLDAITIYDWD